MIIYIYIYIYIILYYLVLYYLIWAQSGPSDYGLGSDCAFRRIEGLRIILGTHGICNPPEYVYPLAFGLPATVPYWLADWLAGWLTDWLADCLTDWLPVWLIDWLAGWLTCWLTDWLADWLTDGPTDWLTDRRSFLHNFCVIFVAFLLNFGVILVSVHVLWRPWALPGDPWRGQVDKVRKKSVRCHLLAAQGGPFGDPCSAIFLFFSMLFSSHFFQVPFGMLLGSSGTPSTIKFIVSPTRRHHLQISTLTSKMTGNRFRWVRF